MPGYDPRGRPLTARAPAPKPEPEPSGPPTWAQIGAQLQAGPSKAALAYLGVYLLGEALAATLDARLGLLTHAGLLLAVLFHGANVPAGPERSFLWTLWLAPLTRIYGLALPYAGAPPLFWWALTAVPMVVAAVVAMRLAGLTARDARLIPSPREAPIAVFMAPVGLALGVATYLVLEPRTLGQELAFGGAALVALVAIVNPGIVDEIVFRGVLQRGVAGVFGTGLSVLYVSLLYATIVPAGLVERSSLSSFAVTFGVGLLLSAITVRTGSILSAAVAHAGLAVGLFVLAPLLMPSTVGPASSATVPPPTEVRLPTPKPAVIVASPPARAQPQPSPAGQPGPAGQPASAGQPGQQPPPGGQPPSSLPTPIILAPPLPPPQSAPAAPGPAGGPQVQGQAVVVWGTGGTGARLRAQPGNSGPIITVIPEGAPLLVIGADRTVDGLVWRNVRAPNGNEGWIAAQFISTGQ